MITPEHSYQARLRARTSGRGVIQELRDLMGQDENALYNDLAAVLHVSLLDGPGLDALDPAFDLLRPELALKHGAVLARSPSGTLTLVMTDPFDDELISSASLIAATDLVLTLTSPSNLQRVFSKNAAKLFESDGAGNVFAAIDEQPNEVMLADDLGAAEGPVVWLLNTLVNDALAMQASDIHLETMSTGLRAKFRIDGILVDRQELAGSSASEQLISRVKVLAELDITERRIPQDGRFKMSFQGRAIDFRVSIMPSIHGEDAVIRILDKRALADQFDRLSLDFLGFAQSTILAIRELCTLPHGMLLVTGPTGSGKTTTLYAALSEINSGTEKIVTIEDPVEYQIEGVLQIPVSERKGLTFARGLRSILRHDPDKILVGEIRDPETAQIAIQAALTGHLVFTTVHANNAADVLGRFLHMGVESYSFVSALNGIFAQRLVRTVCADCREEYAPDERLFEFYGLDFAALRDSTWIRGKGCKHCHGTGYRGRTAIGELLVVTENIRDVISSKGSARQISEVAANSGMTSLRQAGLALAQGGQTTLEELRRVVA
jgi:general secretion pathway protein E